MAEAGFLESTSINAQTKHEVVEQLKVLKLGQLNLVDSTSRRNKFSRLPQKCQPL